MCLVGNVVLGLSCLLGGVVFYMVGRDIYRDKRCQKGLHVRVAGDRKDFCLHCGVNLKKAGVCEGPECPQTASVASCAGGARRGPSRKEKEEDIA